MPLSAKFSEALSYATDLHRDQVRKGTSIPYVSHLLAVSSLVLEAGGDETLAIAALLHDALEDQGRGGQTEREIRERFGESVLDLVRGCTDTEQTPKPPWRARKEAYLAHLRHAPPATRLVSCADKLHNARAIVADLHAHGDVIWGRFSGGKDGVLWYYDALATAFLEHRVGPLATELHRTVERMKALARA